MCSVEKGYCEVSIFSSLKTICGRRTCDAIRDFNLEMITQVIYYKSVNFFFIPVENVETVID